MPHKLTSLSDLGLRDCPLEMCANVIHASIVYRFANSFHPSISWYIADMRSILPANDNPVLHEEAKEVPHAEIRSAYMQELIADMKRLLVPEKYGVALAAPQVGDPVRLFIIAGKALARRKKDTPEEPISEDQVYINPTITKMSKAKKDKHEGCLSLPGYWGEVPRAEKVTIEAYDEHGKKFTRGASGFLAHIFQHEVDHLEGVVYTEKATALYEETDENHAD